MTVGASAPNLSTLPPPLAAEVEKVLAALDAGGAPDAAKLEALCDRPAQAGAWEALLAVTSRAVESALEAAGGDPDDGLETLPAKLPRLYVKAAEETGGGDALAGALDAAHRALPKDATI